jgi:PilZ domain
VDRRNNYRHLTGIGVRVTDLSKPERSGHGCMNDISETGIGVTVPFALVAGDIVQLDIDDSTLFGHVVHASREGAAFRAGIELQRVLVGGGDISKVLHIALREMVPDVPGVLVGT